MSGILKFTRHDYTCRTTLDRSTAYKLFDAIIARQYSESKPIKDNRHNFVARVKTEDFDASLIIKAPRRRDAGSYSRFLSLFRQSEVSRYFDSHITLGNLGFHCPTPLLVAEKRRFGMVFSSFFVYEYIEGRPPEPDDAGFVGKTLQSLHQKGYTRSDPKAENFLISPNGDQLFFIDFKLQKHHFFVRIQTLTEFAHLLHTLPEAIDYLPVQVRNSLLFRVIYWFRLYLSAFKRKKRNLLKHSRKTSKTS